MALGRRVRTIGIVLGTAVAVSAAPAVARTVVDYARNAGHVDGYRAIAATRCPPKPRFGSLPPCPKRSGVLVATNSQGYLPNDVVLKAQDSTRLGGLVPNRYAQLCRDGTVTGFAQVPGDIGSTWTAVRGYGHSLLIGGPFPGVFECTEYRPKVRQPSTGLYLVSLGVRSCGGTAPRPGGTIPAVVTVMSRQEVVATYERPSVVPRGGWNGSSSGRSTGRRRAPTSPSSSSSRSPSWRRKRPFRIL